MYVVIQVLRTIWSRCLKGKERLPSYSRWWEKRSVLWSSGAETKKSGKVKLVEVEHLDGLHEAIIRPQQESVNLVRSEDILTWHTRPGHRSLDVIRATISHVIGVNCSTKASDGRKCELWNWGKFTRASRTLKHPQKAVSSAQFKMCIVMLSVLWRQTLGKSKYFVGVLDEFSGYSMIRFINW